MTSKAFKIIEHKLLSVLLILVIAASTLISGCSGDTTTTSKPTPKPVPTPPISTTITVVTDPSLEEKNKKDPYSQISANTLEVYKLDKALYNTLYNAVDKMETTVDISGFQLSNFEKVTTSESLYGQAGFEFYYLKRIKLSKDGKSVLITYNDTEEVKKDKEIFYSRMSHLIYNAAPEDYSPLQKLFSVYDYINAHADYTDDMQDESTFSAYSILMKGKGICGGFSTLGHYVLNRVGIQTEYISNEPHAWNMVTIDGENYHTDITWGAGNYGNPNNFINTILMDDEQRKLGLVNMGFGEYPIIKGFPRDNPVKPLPAADKRFKVYYDFYNSYALDIENNLIYYSDEDGIKRMTLDGKELEIVSPISGGFLTTFNGILYFADNNEQQLYKLQPGKEAELLDDSVKVGNMKLKNGILHYESIDNTTKEKTLNLNPFVQANFDINSSKHKESITVPRQQTFKFDISFSRNMNTDVLPREAVGLVNKEGQAIPIHMNWSEDGRKLTVRSQVALDNESAVSLYVSPGIAAADGMKSEEAYDLTVNIQ